MIALVLLVLLALAPAAQATVRYVNNTASCPGSGTSGAPYCDPQSAISVSVGDDNTGDTLSEVPYDFDGYPRPYEYGYDMGAYEWHP